MADTTRILLVEDDPADAYILRWHLLSNPRIRHRFDLEHVQHLGKGLDRLSEDDFQILLLDLGLPDSLGLETFCRANQEAPDVPIIVLSGLDDEDVALNAVREGAQDYLVKSDVTGPLLVRSIRYAIERHQMKQSLRDLSLQDELTGLYNRRGFVALAEQQLKQLRRSDKTLGLVFADLDGLKEINDSQGHQTGDQALREIAEVLLRSVRDSDIVARMGGDEFAVLLVDADRDGIQLPLSRLRENLAEVDHEPERAYGLSLSLGLATSGPAEPRGLEEMIAEADRAMYRDKRRRKKARGNGH